jgi:molybdenum cofactor cytidylyltransferase
MPDEPQHAHRSFRLGAIILAAGGSSRMGAVKQLLDVGGKPLVARVVDAALSARARPVVVVLGANAELVEAALAGRVIIAVRNPDWSAGLSSSIRVGLAALVSAEPSIEAVLLAPCDQPSLSSDAIIRLSGLYRTTGLIAAAHYHGRNGAPAVFGRECFDALGRLTGDEGARRLLNGDAESVAELDLPELGIDLDTPEDYARWQAR